MCPNALKGGRLVANSIFSNSFLMLERSMNFQWVKQRALLDNIVNAETPGYKAKYVTFEEAFRAQIQAAAAQGQPASRMRGVVSTALPTVHTATEETTRLDDNGVNIGDQLVEATRNAYQIQYVYEAMNRDLGRLRAAIRGQ